MISINTNSVLVAIIQALNIYPGIFIRNRCAAKINPVVTIGVLFLLTTTNLQVKRSKNFNLIQ